MTPSRLPIAPHHFSLEVELIVPDRKRSKRSCRSVSQRDQDPVKPSKDWVPLQMAPDLIERMEAYLENDKAKVGCCLLCNSRIESADDFITGTNTHTCPEGLRFEEGRKEP